MLFKTRRKPAAILIAGPALVYLAIWISFFPNPLYNRHAVVEGWLEGIEDAQVRSETASVVQHVVNAWIPDLQDVALFRLTPHQPERAIALGKVLRYGRAHARSIACCDLLRSGPSAAAVVPDLIHALEDNEEDVRWRAAYALGNLGAPAFGAVPILRKQLQDPQVRARIAAAEALFKLTGIAEETVPLLRGSLKDPSEYVRLEAAESLIEIGKFDDEVEKVVLETLRDESYYQGLRAGAILALEKVPPLSSRGLEALRRAANDRDWFVFTSANECLIRLGLDSRETIERIRKTLLSDSSFGMRRWAAQTLGKLGPGAAEAIPALLTATKDDDEEVRSAAAEALRAVQNR